MPTWLKYLLFPFVVVAVLPAALTVVFFQILCEMVEDVYFKIWSRR